jgi:cytochrome c5
MRKFSSTTWITVILLISAVLLQECKHDVPKVPSPDDQDTTPIDPIDTNNPCHPDTVYFERQILPILLSNCAISGCHNETTHAEGIDLSSYGRLVQSDVVKAFKPGDSELYDKITKTKPDEVMPPPPMSKLPSDQIALINKWINQGALNLKCNSGCDTSNVTWTKDIEPFIKSTCIGCHGSSFPSGGVVLATYADVKTRVDMGRILGNVRRENGFLAMPPSGSPVSKCNVDKIRIWIEMGAPQN